MNDNDYVSSDDDIYGNKAFGEYDFDSDNDNNSVRSEGYLTDNTKKKKRKPVLHRPGINKEYKRMGGINQYRQYINDYIDKAMQGLVSMDDFDSRINLNEINNIVANTLKDHQEEMSGAFIAPIHPSVNIKYNSVNVIVGKQNMGKTVIALQEKIKISLLYTHHLLVYVTKDGEENDRSWRALRDLFSPTLPYVTIAEADAENYIRNLIGAKNLYYKIKHGETTEQQEGERIQQMKELLHVNNYSAEFLHTLVLFDDISNSKLFSNEESFFSQAIKRCRHTNMSYFLLIQGWKGLKPHVKNEITSLFIFPCFNDQQLRYIYSQAASNLSWEDFNYYYKLMVDYKRRHPDSYPALCVQVTDGGETNIIGGQK